MIKNKFEPKLQNNKDLRIKYDHETEIINLNGNNIEVDIEMVNIIQEMNKLGLKTMWCCQGDKKFNSKGIKNRAYICIDNSNVKIELDQKDRIVLRWERENNE